MRKLSKLADAAPPEAQRDCRFRALLGPEAWARLPPRIRMRFGGRAPAGETIVYAGEIVACRRTRLGRMVVELARRIGAPLPLSVDTGVAAIVSVMEDGAGGQFWTRTYLRRRGFPQVIHSRKQFAGETGLEELLGLGVGIISASWGTFAHLPAHSLGAAYKWPSKKLDPKLFLPKFAGKTYARSFNVLFMVLIIFFLKFGLPQTYCHFALGFIVHVCPCPRYMLTLIS